MLVFIGVDEIGAAVLLYIANTVALYVKPVPFRVPFVPGTKSPLNVTGVKSNMKSCPFGSSYTKFTVFLLLEATLSMALLVLL